MSPDTLLAFASVIFFLIISPGPNMILVMQTAGAYGTRAAIYNYLGIFTGTVFYTVAGGLGLSLIAEKFAAAFTFIHMAGALYLMYLGFCGWRSAWRLHRAGAKLIYADANFIVSRESHAVSYWKGCIASMLNVATAFIFIALFPHFIHNKTNILPEWLLLSLIFTAMQGGWYCTVIFALSKMQRFLMRAAVQKWMNVITGTLLIFLGAKIGLQ